MSHCLAPRPLAILLGVALLAACTNDAGAPPPSPVQTPASMPGGRTAVFEPEPGVLCNRAREICVDRSGASIAHTRDHFGPAAAQRLLRRMLPERDDGIDV